MEIYKVRNAFHITWVIMIHSIHFFVLLKMVKTIINIMIGLYCCIVTESMYVSLFKICLFFLF